MCKPSYAKGSGRTWWQRHEFSCCQPHFWCRQKLVAWLRFVHTAAATATERTKKLNFFRCRRRRSVNKVTRFHDTHFFPLPLPSWMGSGSFTLGGRQRQRKNYFPSWVFTLGGCQRQRQWQNAMLSNRLPLPLPSQMGIQPIPWSCRQCHFCLCHCHPPVWTPPIGLHTTHSCSNFPLPLPSFSCERTFQRYKKMLAAV